MKNQHLNYCRQALKQFAQSPAAVNDFQKEYQPSAAKMLSVAEKFMLPLGGRLFDDKHYKAMDETEALRLPFQVIALEYASATDKNFSRRILLAIDYENSDSIVVMPIIHDDKKSIWFCLPPAFIPRIGYLSRENATKEEVPFVVNMPDGIEGQEYGCEIGTLLCLLNTLQCSNVHLEKRKAKANTKVKNALPFDDYYVLSVDSKQPISNISGGGTHRSPREHLRRGHIRRLETGRKIWVNAAVIGAGKGAGKITKDYLVN